MHLIVVFSWLFILIHVFYCLILYWLLIITYLSWFLAYLSLISLIFQTFCIGFISDLVLYISVLDLLFISSLVVYLWMLWSFINTVLDLLRLVCLAHGWFLCEWLFLFRCFRIFDVVKGGENHVRYKVYIFFCKPFWKYFMLSNECKIKGEWSSRKRNIFSVNDFSWLSSLKRERMWM